MKIQYCSDLHLEFPENRRLLARYPLMPRGEILLLAGDIVCFNEMEKARDFFDFVSDHFSQVYWVPGNHEYYGSDIDDKPRPLDENIRPNVHLINNQTMIAGGYRLIFTTLWSRISPANEGNIQNHVSDFSAIACAGKNFTARRFTQLHGESLAFLRKELISRGDTPAIVITHHVPTLMNYPPVYKNSPLNEAFAVELFGFIEKWGPAYWIYGHHHANTPAFQIGRTEMLTNQLGYVHHREHGMFRRDLAFDLNAL